MSDLIDRQDAIDALRYAQHRFTVADEAGGIGTVKWIEDVIYFAAAERILTELPPAQPERCEDCENFNKTRLLIPQPQRKKGHWIRHPEQKNIFNGKTIECSECHEKYTVRYVEDVLFCRHCGADMREPEDIPMEYFESGGR